MATNVDSGKETLQIVSKDEPKTVVSSIGYGVKVRITTFSDGSQGCDVSDVTVDDPSKDPVPEVPVAAAPAKDSSIVTEPAAAVAAAPRAVPENKGGECSVCAALLNALKEQAAKSSPAPRQAPRQQPRRMTRS